MIIRFLVGWPICIFNLSAYYFSIGLELMWCELKKKNIAQGKANLNLSFEMLFEEKVWYLASMVEKFDLKKLERQINEKIKDRLEMRENSRVSMNESTIL